jgi:ribose transport system permease protein
MAVDTQSEEVGRPTEARRVSPLGRVGAVKELGAIVALLVLVVVISVFHPDFLSRGSLINVGQQAALYGIMAIGMVFLLSMREIDLSVGAIFAVSLLGGAVLMKSGLDPWLAGVASIVIGIALGAVNGTLTNVLGIPSIIVTLGTLSMYRGVGLIIAGGQAIGGLDTTHPFFVNLGGGFLGVPISIWALLVLVAFFSVVYNLTRFGIVVRAIGSNEQAARLSGISIRSVRLGALTLTGGFCGLSGMLSLAYFGSADPTIGTGYELQVIASAIIGGTALSGGSGTVIGALLGSLLIAVIQAGLIQFGVNANWSVFGTGAVIVAAVTLDAVIRRQRARQLALR